MCAADQVSPTHSASEVLWGRALITSAPAHHALHEPQRSAARIALVGRPRRRRQERHRHADGRRVNGQEPLPGRHVRRHAPADDVKNLAQLAGHLQESLFITKFRKTFARDEMNDDLLIVPARYNGAEDTSEYEEMLPSSPP